MSKHHHAADFVVFRSFNDPALAAELMSLLDKADISYQVFDSNKYHTSLGFNNPRNQIDINLLPEDFESAENLLSENTQIDLSEISSNHYLLSFSDDELLDILNKPDEWSPEDFSLARQLLIKHGKTVTDNDLKTMKENRLKELAQPESEKTIWIILGYIFAVLGGAIAIIIGWTLYKQKKVLPNGASVFAFTEPVRRHGVRIFFLGTVFLILHILLWIRYQI